jgi:hypothetical protein
MRIRIQNPDSYTAQYVPIRMGSWVVNNISNSNEFSHPIVLGMNILSRINFETNHAKMFFAWAGEIEC